ncbi:MAG: class C sortase [Oscillospiraceae bacterium]|nr:class C sortase [Oscillospiraceae bacterium]
MKQRILNFILTLILITGLSLLLYPSVSNWWNAKHQSRAIASYSEAIEKVDTAAYEATRASAMAYNRTIPMDKSRFEMSDEQRALYDQELNLAGDGIMGIVEIPDIGVELPLYHGTSEAILQVAAGHIEGTSLPVGGPGTHCALSGHRGLPSARLFTDLDQLSEGDVFLMHILNETLTYQVDQILIVKPYELEGLAIEEGKDYCTLVTCTPYGINTHRLLVRGVRIETVLEKAPVRVTADAVRVEPLIVAPILVSPLLVLLLLVVAVYDPKKK